jgi:hypothetical protein
MFMATSFTNKVSVLVAEKDEFLSSAQRSYLAQLASDPVMDGIWQRIEKKCGERSDLEIRFFIQEIARCRSLSDGADEWPDYRAHAKNTARVIRFLKGSQRLPPPLPKYANPTFIASLEEMASFSRQRGNCIHISRENVRGSRQYIVFMQLLSQTMQEFFHRWFDSEVADITNIFFPKACVTNYSVRAARRKARWRIAA